MQLLTLLRTKTYSHSELLLMRNIVNGYPPKLRNSRAASKRFIGFEAKYDAARIGLTAAGCSHGHSAAYETVLKEQ